MRRLLPIPDGLGNIPENTRIQAKWGKLTANDLKVIEANRKQIAGRIQQRYEYTKEQIQREFDEWVKSL